MAGTDTLFVVLVAAGHDRRGAAPEHELADGEQPSLDDLGPDLDLGCLMFQSVTPDHRRRALARLFAGPRYRVAEGRDGDPRESAGRGPAAGPSGADWRQGG